MKLRKYRNKPFKDTEGILWHSKGEHARWLSLKWLEKAGGIQSLSRQVKYDFQINGVKITSYIADFEYIENGVLVTEDFKGVLTPEFKIKAKLFEAIHHRKIKITKSK